MSWTFKASPDSCICPYVHKEMKGEHHLDNVEGKEAHHKLLHCIHNSNHAEEQGEDVVED